MIEFAVLVVALAVILVLTARRGTQHLQRKFVLGLMMTVGWAVGFTVHALTSTAVSPGVDVMTVLSGLIGLFAARLLVRVAQAWAIAHRGWQETSPESPPRLLHPAIALGLFLSGGSVLYAAVAARHESLEYATTPRTPSTGIARGAGPIALDPDAPTDHAVLLVHGFLSNPSVFGDLPTALRDAGLAVRAPLLPGHGTRPDDAMGHTEQDWRDAVEAAYHDAASTHARVSVVGFSMGCALTLTSELEPAPHRLAFVNPYLGTVATPPWLPVETDTLIDVAARLTPRVFRPGGMARVNDPGGLARLVTYHTIPLESVEALRRLGGEVRERGAAPLAAPALVLLAAGDETAPPQVTRDWVAALPQEPVVELREYPRSNHVLLLDYDARAAVAAIVDWVCAE